MLFILRLHATKAIWQLSAYLVDVDRKFVFNWNHRLWLFGLVVKNEQKQMQHHRVGRDPLCPGQWKEQSVVDSFIYSFMRRLLLSRHDTGPWSHRMHMICSLLERLTT